MLVLSRVRKSLISCAPNVLSRLSPGTCRTLTNPRGCICLYSSKTEKDEDGPIKFSSSEAASGRSARVRNKRDAPWFEAPIIMTSLAAFMIYFCILREENDLDDEMRVSLFDRLPGLEKNQLEIVMEYNKERGIDTKPLESRLKEIESKS